MDNILIPFKGLQPHVRYANFLRCDKDFMEGPRRIYDHQLIYVHKGKGIVEINSITYNALPGDLFFYGPGVQHAFRADSEDPYVLSGIHFDFTPNHKDIPFPIGPYNTGHFKEELMTENVSFADFCGFPPYINISGNHRAREIILELVGEFESGKLFAYTYINGLFTTFLSILARCVMVREKGAEYKEEIVIKVLKFIHRHYNENFTNKNIADHFHFHPNYLNQLMAAHTGLSLRQYIIDLRIKKAVDMMVNTNMSVCAIAKDVGYEDIHYFSRLFKKKTGYTPVQIKRKLYPYPSG